MLKNILAFLAESPKAHPLIILISGLENRSKLRNRLPLVVAEGVIGLKNISRKNRYCKNDGCDHSDLEELLTKGCRFVLVVIGFVATGDGTGKALVGFLEYYRNYDY
jgi:hypothetical protein